MLSLEIDKDAEEERPDGFLERQFQSHPTLAQKKSDWVFGVILPIVCIAADPIVFRSSIGIGPRDLLLAEYKIFAYVLSSVSIMAMAAWLMWGERLGELRGYLGGLFLAASVVSLVVGIVLAPFSLMGMVFLIGLLGFTPFFSSFVFFRNATRILDSARDDYPPQHVWQSAVLGLLYGLAVPFALNF